MAKIVIGMDGGGTYTRAVVADLSGRILATAITDAASPNKTVHARENVQGAIYEAVSRASHTLSDVVALVAGIAGLDDPEDLKWAEEFTALPGLECSRLHVNDAVVAHAGALQSQPGIIVISGTGSIIFGMTESGRQIRNYDFHHYAHSSARSLSYDVVYRVLVESIEPEDSAFVADILAFWKARDIAELRQQGLEGFIADNFERQRVFGIMAPLVTDAAQKGVPLARTACDAAAESLGIGIRLLGNCFTGDAVSVALIGSVAQSVYMQQRIENVLAKSTKKRFEIVESAFSSEVGAVLMALAQYGVAINDELLTTLRANQA